MLPLMDREFVEKRGWLTEEDMIDTVAVVQSVPGVIAVNMAILIGRKVAGIPAASPQYGGSVCSGRQHRRRLLQAAADRQGTGDPPDGRLLHPGISGSGQRRQER